MRPSPKTIPSRRKGFTLVELMIAITIIALLIGLLVPAVMNVRTRVQVGEVQTDINEIATGLTTFQAQYGFYPPSRITIHPDLAGWNGDRRSKTIIRKYWPQFDFTTSGGLALSSAATLDGSECLLFFLGGVRDADDAYIGFSKNPALPFSPSGSSRVGPFLEVEQSRLDDSDTDGDGFWTYFDPIASSSQPYVYYSSYDGQGYQTDDFLGYGGSGSGKPTFYRTGTAATAQGWKPQSFQIISAGADGSFGPGGPYLPDDADSLPTPPAGRGDEADNITNFSGGTLQ